MAKQNSGVSEVNGSTYCSQLSREYLLWVWNRFWFSDTLEPQIVDCPPEYSDDIWIGMVYGELLNRDIWPILEIQGWHEELIAKIKADRSKVLLDQQRDGLNR